MVLEQIEKSKFAQINDKRYYFSDGIVWLLFSHPYLHKIVQLKRDKKRFYKKKNINLLRWKNFPWKKTQEFRFIGAFYNKNRHFTTLTR